ncbi:MAG: hypothetical protein DRJ40_11775 [Thermoprotei archaeon]|nr:MAG: hypothetical protein DRJ40_11775 [Thermoprotei archaeon]
MNCPICGSTDVEVLEEYNTTIYLKCSRCGSVFTRKNGHIGDRVISCRVPREMLEEMRKLVAEGKYPNISVLVRKAIKNLLDKERGNQVKEVAICGEVR